MKNEWVHKRNHANRHKRAQSTHRFPKWQIGNRRGGKYVLKGEGKTFVGWGTHFILLNQFVRFFLEPRYQKSRVFPCKLPSLISLFDMLHCTTTHQRPSVRWGKRFKAQMGAEPVYPWALWITSFTLMSNRRQEEEEHKSKDLHRLRNLRRFMLSPATPIYDSRSVISFFLFISSPRISFHFLFSVCVSFCHVRCAPAHPLLHPAALPSSSSSLVPAHTLAKQLSANHCDFR